MSIFMDKEVAVTGRLAMTRVDAHRSLLRLGANVMIEGITKNTGILIVGADPSPSQIKGANAMGVRMLTEDEFMGYVNGVVVPEHYGAW